MNLFNRIVLIALLLWATASLAQINLVVADFSNNSSVYFLDAWERSVPNLLRAELARSEHIVVLDRERMDKLFEEQKLALAGFIDSSTVQEVGQLLGAQFIITGNVDQVDRRFRIDVNLIRVKTGEVHAEKALAPDADHLQEMINLLSNNIIYFLTGKGQYRENVSIANYPTKYFIAATVGFSAAALFFNQQYRDNLKKYEENVVLETFDTYYDKANNARKVTAVMASVAGTAFVGTLWCWLKNRSTEQITAGSGQSAWNVSLISLYDATNEVALRVQVTF